MIELISTSTSGPLFPDRKTFQWLEERGNLRSKYIDQQLKNLRPLGDEEWHTIWVAMLILCFLCAQGEPSSLQSLLPVDQQK